MGTMLIHYIITARRYITRDPDALRDELVCVCDARAEPRRLAATLAERADVAHVCVYVISDFKFPQLAYIRPFSAKGELDLTQVKLQWGPPPELLNEGYETARALAQADAPIDVAEDWDLILDGWMDESMGMM